MSPWDTLEENYFTDLMCDRSDVFEGKRLELVLLKEIIQILLQHLKNEACVVFVREALVRSNKVEFVRIFLAAKKKIVE